MNKQQISKLQKKEQNSLVGQIAFWEYDLFPFVLSAEIESNDNVMVKLENYGFYDKKLLLFILPNPTGKLFQIRLNELKQKRQEMLRFIEATFKSELDLIFKDIKKCNKIS